MSSTARIDAQTSTASIYGFEVLLGVGTGAFIQAGYAVIQAVVDPVDMAYAISFMMIGEISFLPCLDGRIYKTPRANRDLFF